MYNNYIHFDKNVTPYYYVERVSFFNILFLFTKLKITYLLQFGHRVNTSYMETTPQF